MLFMLPLVLLDFCLFEMVPVPYEQDGPYDSDQDR
jgi:hypothetical protein